ncbi:probable CCR4-associated factor 1 homolog 9 [Brachypodium distachyon]|nr:probable CCR4-associated factor 1 homolog 9 [Brachypodium distachyon]|eukprot:XP_024313267.1 probable CCR4-associated factor 1 homolog 9 [Brachypodium distachyon]
MPVTAWNLDAAMELMASLLPLFPYVAVDTEYPGVVHHHSHSPNAAAAATAEERYAVAKANVDELPIVQLGITLCDDQGRLPVFQDHLTGCHVEVSWEINFTDFDAGVHRHAPESVNFLRSQGVDFDLARAQGVTSNAFGHKFVSMLSSPSSNANKLTWAMFGGMYDLGYLFKILTGGQPLPERKEMFVREVKARLGGGRLFDAKYMAERCGRGDLRGVGLKRVAANLGVPRHYPEPPCLAGPKSILACRIFTALRRSVFSPDGGACLEGCIDGMQ